jgi:hypothetical protein
MSMPTLSLSGQIVTTTWTAAVENGDAISQYRILFLYKNGTFIENPSLCNGADPTVRTTLSCTTNMTHLTSSPVLLVKGDLVSAKIQALNNKGWSPVSYASTSLVYALTIPSAIVSNLVASIQTLTSVAL